MNGAWWRGLGDLDEDQKAVMALSLDGRFYVSGPPGSGKTNLLLLRANFATLKNRKNIRIVVFNRTLREFIARGSINYDFDPAFVVTSTQLLRAIVAQEGGNILDGADVETARESYMQQVDRMISDGLSPQFDLLFVDEAQDYSARELRLLSALAENIMIVADSRQKIYDVDDGVAGIVGTVDERLVLRFHYRNGLAICRLADAVGAQFSGGYFEISPTSNYDEEAEPSRVEIVTGSFGEQVTALKERLLNQVRTYPNDDIGVLAPTRETALAVHEQLIGTQLDSNLNCQVRSDEGGYGELDPSRRIWISTVHGSKGMEFRAVHLMDMEAFARSGPSQKRLAYTGITRAKTSLTCYHNRPLPPYLAAPASMFQRPVDGNLMEKVFGPQR